MSDLKAGITQFKKTVVCPLANGRSMIRTKFDKGCFIYYSFGKEESRFDDILVRPLMTFLADGGQGVAAEWEPQYGPIQVWREAPDADWKGKDAFGNEIGARRHWHFPFIQNHIGNWSQIAVTNEGLKESVLRGDFESVFSSLMKWAKRDNK